MPQREGYLCAECGTLMVDIDGLSLWACPKCDDLILEGGDPSPDFDEDGLPV